MSSNYPPGVTGMEYAIGGAEREWEEKRTCPECDTEDVMHHEAHREFGVWAWCTKVDCEKAVIGFEVYDEFEGEF